MTAANPENFIVFELTFKIKPSNDEKGSGIVSETKHIINIALIQNLFKLTVQYIMFLIVLFICRGWCCS